MANGVPPAVPPSAPVGMPSWFQPLVGAITTLGIPTVFAGILLWFVLTKLDTALQVIMANEDARTQKLTAIETGFVSALDRQTLAFNQTIQGNIAAIDRQTKTFEELMQENTTAVRQNAEINRLTATALQRMPAGGPPP